jgi:hypothetical protein
MTRTKEQPNGTPTSPPAGPQEQLERLADRGDVAAVLDRLVQGPDLFTDLPQLTALLSRSVRAVSHQGGRAVCRDLHRQALAFLQYVGLRLQASALRIAADSDRLRGASPDRVPADLTDRVLPQVAALFRLQAELAHSWAATERLWGLARRRRPASRQANPNTFWDFSRPGEDGEADDDPLN